MTKNMSQKRLNERRYFTKNVITGNVRLMCFTAHHQQPGSFRANQQQVMVQKGVWQGRQEEDRRTDPVSIDPGGWDK